MAKSALATEWAKVIRERRPECGYARQADLAAKLEVAQQTVSMWENAESIPSPAMQAKLIRLLRIGPDDLWNLMRAGGAA